ncbi:unnamed protein product [Vicia faba]|uniref:Trichome birefringence-like N-terminal domain-containing protein n=1 Tax=Vicia faba TaxID=3906 RepID=A0AAV0YQD7_VICFA|nr:unnamed protein product [Vicia faba]
MGFSLYPFKDHFHSLTKKLFPWTLYALLPIALLSLYLYPLPFLPSTESELSHSISNTIISHSTPPSFPSTPPPSEKENTFDTPLCDYFNGKWIRDRRGPLYNGTTCGTIKQGQNCIKHGRPDSDYLYWRWKPNECKLPRFEPNTFLEHIENKHVAFVGDSMARNQLESLLCMLSTVSSPDLVYTNGEDNKFRKWRFDSHNASVSVYWSPFLVQGVEKSNGGLNHNKLYLDLVDERWAKDMDHMDLIVFSVGHWFLHPAVYYEGDLVLGCHYCVGLNHTEIGFYEVLRKALRTSLNSVIDRRGSKGGKVDVMVTTFSPAHFEGEWDKVGACSKTRPYRSREKELEGMDGEMRKTEVEEVEDAKVRGGMFGGIRFEALDVTKLALLRPDGHPGAIDTWNEIFLEIMKKWEEHPRIQE